MITQLQRQLGHEPGILARFDEPPNAFRNVWIVEDAELVDGTRLVRARDGQAFHVLLRRRGIGRLGENQDLALDLRLEFGEALVDGAAIAQHLDVLERVGVGLAGHVGRLEHVDHDSRTLLELGQLLTMRLNQHVDGDLGRSGGVLHHRPRPGDGQALLHKRAQHVVDALARQCGLAGDLRRGVRVALDQGQVGLRLIAGQSKARELPDELAVIHS